jgi:hypothetical protein
MCATALPPPPPTPIDLDHGIRCHFLDQFKHVYDFLRETTALFVESGPNDHCKTDPRIAASNSPRYHIETFDQNVRSRLRRRGRPARVLDLTAPQQQADAGGMHRVADDSPRPVTYCGMPRCAPACGSISSASSTTPSIFAAPPVSTMPAAPVLEAAATQFGLHQRRTAPRSAALTTSASAWRARSARRAIAHARHLDRSLPRWRAAPARRRSAP